jgi:SAM-dependent methyltransferase
LERTRRSANFRSEMSRAASEWEAFARRDPQYYIDPTYAREGVREFRDVGRGVVDWAVLWAGEHGEQGYALEIGCGVGRNTVHLAPHFEHVDAVDISPTMVRAARERGLPDNVSLHAVSGADLAPFNDERFGFVFSSLVFQHIEKEWMVESYLREVARVLAPGGVVVLQFDTRPDSLLASLARRLPDPLLPRDRRRGMRRHRRRPERLRELAANAGLRFEAEHNPNTAFHWFRWRHA